MKEDLKAWSILNNKLEKSFQFNNFASAIEFINNIAIIAEKVNHHPDIRLHSYKIVDISLFTHKHNKITNLDYNLSKEIDKIFMTT
ncbi:MAG: 4a-hydroxytetrahydrobiopterin dehydratase [Marinifilaceae bacterium]|jgi:4a-hydroxytetrahydrobiopterin dehydratase|nr:4a-hydroxytetrahydrobiopterin dehydratase [Marinifilaceae bacterium]